MSDHDNQTMLLSEFFDKHYRPKRLPNCSESSTRQYQIQFRKLERFLGRPSRLSDLTDDTLAGYMNWMLEMGRSARTANKARDNLSALWRYANRRQLISTWPDVAAMQEYQRAPIAWTVNEFQQLLDAAGSEEVLRWKAVAGIPAWLWWTSLLITLYDTGARIGAMYQVRCEDYQPELRRLRIRAEFQKQRADQVFLLDPQTASLLNQLLQHNRQERLFPWEHVYTYLWHDMNRLLKLANLPTGRDSGFHRIRKTTATLAELHIGRGTATGVLGHSDGRITEKYIDRSQLPESEVASKLPRPILTMPDGKYHVTRFAPEMLLAEVLEVLKAERMRQSGEARDVHRLAAAFEACGFRTVADVDLVKLSNYVARLRDDLVPNSMHKARQQVQRFVAWLADRLPGGGGAISDEQLPPVLTQATPTPDEHLDAVRGARAKTREAIKRSVDLNERTQLFLKLLASDRSPKDIARQMKLPEKAVYDSLNRVRNRLGLSTTYGLVTWAVVNGLACELPQEQQAKGGAA